MNRLNQETVMNAPAYLCPFGQNKKSFLLAFLFWALLNDTIHAQDFRHIQLTTGDGLPSNTVYAMLQDKKGDMWFSTEYGVSRFNGFSFENFNLEDGLSDNDVFKIFQDSQGRIWFLMSNGTVSYYYNGKVFSHRNSSLLSKLKADTYFNGFLEEAGNILWFTTLRNGIFRVDANEHVTHLKPLADLPGTTIAPGIGKDIENQVRVSTEAGVINLSKNPRVTEIPINTESENIKFSYGLRNGKVLIGMENKLVLGNPATGELSSIGPEAGYSDNIVSSITETSAGDIWIAAINGLHLFRKGEFRKQSHKVFFKGKTVSGFLFDRQGNLWVSTLNEGVFLISDLEAVSYNKWAGLPEIPITSICSFGKRIIFGNDRGGIGVCREGRVEMIPQPRHFFSYGRGRIREFVTDPSDDTRIWAISENGLLLTDGKELKAFYPSASKTIAFLGDTLFLGNANSCVSIKHQTYLKAGEKILRHLQKPAFEKEKIRATMKLINPIFHHWIPETRVYKTRSDGAGTLWMATHNGLYSIQYGKVIFHKEQNPVFGHPFQNLCILPDGGLVLASNGRGILLVDASGKTKWISEKDGLCSNYIRNLKPGSNGDIWICTTSGLNLMNYNPGSKGTIIKGWNSTNSALLSNDVFDAALKGDTLWLAIGHQIQCIPEFLKSRKFSVPPAGIESVEVNNKKLSGTSSYIEAEQGQSLKITIRNADFRNLGKVRFQYRRLPDSLWKPVSQNVIFESLNEPGRFSIELRRITNENKEAGFLLLSIRSKPKNQGFALLFSGYDYLIPALILPAILSLVLAGRLTMRRSGKVDIEGLQRLWISINQLQQNIPDERKYGAGMVAAMLDLRQSLTRPHLKSSLMQEIAACEKLLTYLNLHFQDFQIKLDADESVAGCKTKGLPILNFLATEANARDLSGKDLVFRIIPEGKRVRISLDNNTAIHGKNITICSRRIAVKKPGFLSRLLFA